MRTDDRRGPTIAGAMVAGAADGRCPAIVA
jgi:hypothetical protein